jgi:hypothetical protein
MKSKGVIFDMDGTITEPFFDFVKVKDEAGIGGANELTLEGIGPLSCSRLRVGGTCDWIRGEAGYFPFA